MANPDRARHDVNLLPTSTAVSNQDGETPVSLWADPNTHALVVSGSGGGSITQYTQGATAPTNPVGTYPVYTNVSGVVTAVSISNPLPVSASVATTPDSSAATQNITAQDTASTTSTSNANSQSFRTGTPTAGSVATFALASWETVIVEVTGTWTGTLLVEGSMDNGTIYYQKAVKQIGTSYIANNFTGNFAGTVNVSNLTQLAIRATSTWTGTATVLIRQSINNNGIYVHNGLTIQDATVQSNKLTIKGASASPVATDPSVVVTQSPNSPGATAANQVTMNTTLGTLATLSNQTNGNQQSKITDGTNIANVGAVSGKNGLYIMPNSATGAAIPANAFYIGGQTQTGNLAAPTVDFDGDNAGGKLSMFTLARLELFNGTTWDRQHNNWNTTTGDTGAKTATFNGATQTNYDARGANILFNIGTVSGTTPTLTAQLQGSSDSGTTWWNIPGAVTSSITATGLYLLSIYPGVTVAANAAVSYPLPRTWRVAYTIAGTTPSFTITNVQIGYVA